MKWSESYKHVGKFWNILLTWHGMILSVKEYKSDNIYYNEDIDNKFRVAWCRVFESLYKVETPWKLLACIWNKFDKSVPLFNNNSKIFHGIIKEL